MTTNSALNIVLNFVERHNKQDKETEVAEAAALLEEVKDSLKIVLES